jgi:hypothetical protein
VLATIRCFDESLVPSCQQVAPVYWRNDESTWKVADMSPNLEEVRSDVAKACPLGDGRASSLSDQLDEVLKSKDSETQSEACGLHAHGLAASWCLAS